MKNKHQQVVDLSNPNEGQGTSASTSAIKIRHNMKDEYFIKVYCSQELPKEEGIYFTNTWWLKPIDLEQVKADAWEEACNKLRESLKSNVLIQNDFFVTEINPTNPYKNEEQ
jgi:hypothetical protein